MSLAAFALRLCATRALIGKTIAGDAVSDSVIAPIDDTARADAAPRPVVVVYTDDEIGTVTGRDLLGQDRTIDLVLEMALSSSAVVDAQGGDGQVLEVTIPHTDEGLELTLNLLARQVQGTLLNTPGGWSELWRRLVVEVTKYESRRGAGSKDGVRFAARQLLIQVKPLDEPNFGEPPSGFWADLIAAMRADSDAGDLADMMAALIEGGAATEAWRVQQTALGLADDEVRAMGLGPPFGVDGIDGTAILTEIDAVDDTANEVLQITEDQFASLIPLPPMPTVLVTDEGIEILFS